MSTTTDFMKARLGSTAMEACGACHQETGAVLFKKAGSMNGPEYIGPQLVVTDPDTRCEFCEVLGAWRAQEGIEGRCGVAKIVTAGPNGVRELLAYVPFQEGEDLDKELFDGTKYTFRHRMVLKAEQDDEGHRLVEILEEGV